MTVFSNSLLSEISENLTAPCPIIPTPNYPVLKIKKCKFARLFFKSNPQGFYNLTMIPTENEEQELLVLVRCTKNSKDLLALYHAYLEPEIPFNAFDCFTWTQCQLLPHISKKLLLQALHTGQLPALAELPATMWVTEMTDVLLPVIKDHSLRMLLPAKKFSRVQRQKLAYLISCLLGKVRYPIKGKLSPTNQYYMILSAKALINPRKWRIHRYECRQLQQFCKKRKLCLKPHLSGIVETCKGLTAKNQAILKSLPQSIGHQIYQHLNNDTRRMITTVIMQYHGEAYANKFTSKNRS